MDLNTFLARLGDVLAKESPPPDTLILAITGAVGLLLVGSSAWRFTRYFVTVAHEGSHALVAVLMGRRLSSIGVFADSSGVTVSSGKNRGLGLIFTVLAGYPGPALMALGLAYGLHFQRAGFTLLILAVLLLIMLLLLRSLVGALVVSVLIVGIWAATSLAVELQVALVSLGVWILLFGGLRTFFEIGREILTTRSPDSDPLQLQRLSLVIPGEVWWVIMFVGSFAASYQALALLL